MGSVYCRWTSLGLIAAVAAIAAGCLGQPPISAKVAVSDDFGTQVATELQRRYDLTAAECGPSHGPAFLCSGVLLRATALNPSDASWNPVLPNNYGVSFSFLRRDGNFNSLAGGAVNGFIFYPPLTQPASKRKLEVLCAFPVSAGTENRSEAGCGAHQSYPTESDRCHRLQPPILTADEWLAAYFLHGQNGSRQCGFSTRISDGDYSTANFNAALLAHRFLQSTRFNELRIETWERNIAETLPVEAFFYLADDTRGRDQARRDQSSFKQHSGGLIKPIIRLTLAADQYGRALFTYNPSDQGETPIPDPGPAPYPRQVTRHCESYISRAQWIVRGDGISLAVTPTACARNNLPASDHAFAVDELIGAWSADRRFSNPKGMRDQFLCHLKNAPWEPEWNLEPWRPNVGLAKTEAAYCNPKPSS